MSDRVETPLSPQFLRPLDAVCDAFELAWKEGRQPRIEDSLDTVGDEVRSQLLAELIRTEMEWRCRLGERPSAAEYRERFPSCSERVAEWLAEAQQAGELLTAHGVADTDGPGLSRTGTYLPDRPPAAVATAPPQVLGEYELLESLGSGGMGEVYKARHRRLDKLVALKLLPAGKPVAPQRLARFVREMKAVGGLDHPNVVEAHDAGEQAGVVYLVMKLVEGEDLGALVRGQGPLSIAEACELTRQAALGLQYLHEHGLVHRDIKPSNLMRTSAGVVKILDLGLARWRSEAATGEDLTAAGQAMGTPDYLAPEQIKSAAEADIRADLYGLGGTLFYLLTGRVPFAHRTGLYEKLEAHRTEIPPDVRSLRPDVPPELAKLVSRLLAKRVQDRPQTPGEVAVALAAFTGESSAPTVPMLSRSQIRKERAWRRWCALAAGCVMLVLALLLYEKHRRQQLALVPTDGPAQPSTKLGNGDGPEKVQNVNLNVQHFASIGGQFDQPRGLLGRDSFATHRDDSVTIEAKLPRPAYAFLIAFRPDGTEELCFPEKDDEPPPLTDMPRYPSVSRGVNYGLNEGEGLQVFVLVVSHEPLPTYKEWRAKCGASPWKQHPATTGVVWRDDGTDVEALTNRGAEFTRGKGQEVSGKTPLTEVADWLRRAPQVETVAALGFAVLPKEKP